MLRKILTATALFLVAIFSYSQIPSQLVFSRITKKEGLASNTTFQTVQDKQGFLWIATQNGLQRYDGNRFTTFRHIPGNATSISENAVNHLYVDRKERLWLLFDNQLGIFNTVNFKFTPVKIHTPVSMIRKIMEDGEGTIILFADGKQFQFDEKQQAFPSLYQLPALPTGYTIGDMAVDPSSGAYWFTGKAGSFLFDPKSKQVHSISQNASKNPALDSLGLVKNVRYPFFAKDGSLWLVNWIPFTAAAPVLYNYDKKKNVIQRFEKIRAYKADSYYEIWSVFQQSNGTIWIYGMGLFAYYNVDQKRFIHINSDPFQQYGIEYDYVSSLYEDDEKNVWVSTNKGLYRFNVEAQVFRNLRNHRLNDTTAIPNAVSKVLQTNNNEIWVSTWGAGIFSYNNEFKPISNPVTEADPNNRNLHASSMMQRKNGEIWIGLQTGELKIYDPLGKKTFTISPPLLQGEIIQQVFEDSKGNTWIGTNSGLLVKCEKGNWRDTVSAYKKMLSDATDIFKLYEDANEHLWICTASGGVYEMNISDGKVQRQLTEAKGKNDGLLNNGATDIVQYNDSTFLIASDGLCIFNNRKNTFTYLTASEGLPAEHITALLTDGNKRLWIACDGGLYRLNIDNRLHVSYDASDGIINDVFQVSAGTVLKDGRIALGTPKDFLVFDPEKAIDRKEVPPVIVTGFILGSIRSPVDSLRQLDKVRLKHDNTFIRIELSTIRFQDTYYMYYMLDGLDKTWKQVTNNEIIYQYLPAGNYTLKLKAMNGEGVETKSITTLPIKVYPPFWNTWWFYSLLILLIAILLFWLDHERIKRKTAMLKMRSNIADELHEDINAALGNITILSEMARIKADKEPEKSKEFIQQIHMKSRDMTMAMDDILWSIDPTNDNMGNFMLRFKEYVDALRAQHGVQIDVSVAERSEKFQLKMKSRNDVFWLFKKLVTGIVEAGASKCLVEINYERGNLHYTLEYNLAGVDVNQLNKLPEEPDIIQRLDELKARLDLKDFEDNAVFGLIIPVRNSRE